MTRCCSECGQKIPAKDPLDELYDHVAKQAKSMQARAARETSGYWPRAAEKWEGWRKALAEKMELETA